MAEIDSKSKAASKTRLRLNDRDIQILRYLAKNRFGTVGTIRRLFWKDKANMHYYRRLHQLRDSGYICPIFGDTGAIMAYRLSKRSLREMKNQGYVDERARAVPIYKTTFNHDKKLLQLREILEKSPLVSEYCPEHIVRSNFARKYGIQEKGDERYKVPDAIFKLRTPKGIFRVALELECSRKSMKRYRHIVRALATSEDMDLVFIACDNSPIMLCLKNSLSEARAKDVFVKISKRNNGFYFVDTENLLKEGLNAIFDGEGKQFSLASLQRELSQ